MIKRVYVYGLFLVGLIFSMSAFEFSVSPNDKGSTDVFAQMEWNYNDSFFSGFKAENRSTFEEIVDQYQYIASSGDILSVSLDLLGFQFKSNEISLKTGLNFTYEKMNLKELGYIDSTNNEVTTRFFILNNRLIDLYLPRVTGALVISYPYLSLVAGGEYSPWLYVKLQQELTISPGLEPTVQVSEQNTNHAWSLNGTLRFTIPLVEPRFSINYDHLSIIYNALTAGGPQLIDSNIRIFTLKGSVIPRFINLQGFFPVIGIEYEINRSNTLIDGQLYDGEQRNVKYRFGFAR